MIRTEKPGIADGNLRLNQDEPPKTRRLVLPRDTSGGIRTKEHPRTRPNGHLFKGEKNGKDQFLKTT